MKIKVLCILAAISAAIACFVDNSYSALIVYPPVPGLLPSDHYAVRVRPAGSNASWQTPFVFKTACKDFGHYDPEKFRGKINTEGYCANLSGWSHSYVNFETAGPVEVEITRTDGISLRKATVHPVRYGKNIQIKNGRAYLTLEQPCLVAVDINGEMCDQDTTRTRDGGRYSGPALHGLSLFANPIFTNKPQAGDPGVFTVKPGEPPPTNGNWKTLCFLPGVHDIGLGYLLQSNRNYYIPGDALVYGTFFKPQGGHDIHIFGCGTISGDRLSSPEIALKLPMKKSLSYSPISISGGFNSSVEGITIANAAYWSCMLWANYDAARPSSERWVKVLGWRWNSDGFGAQPNSIIEDCFIRTEDDAIYPCGIGVRRLVIWSDSAGSAFLLTDLAKHGPGRPPLVVEDCDVIFARQSWYNGGSDGRTFNMRGLGKGECGQNVIFRNIRIEDTRPTEQGFLIQMATHMPYVTVETGQSGPVRRGPGDLTGVLFQNIQFAAPSIMGQSNILWGGPDCKIRDLTFDNVTIGGKKLTSISDFITNQYVENIHFK